MRNGEKIKEMEIVSLVWIANVGFVKPATSLTMLAFNLPSQVAMV